MFLVLILLVVVIVVLVVVVAGTLTPRCLNIDKPLPAANGQHKRALLDREGGRNEDQAYSRLVTVLFRHFMYRSSDINFIYDCVDQIFVLT